MSRYRITQSENGSWWVSRSVLGLFWRPIVCRTPLVRAIDYLKSIGVE